MKDAVAEHPDKLHIIDALVAEMRGIVVETKAPVVFHRRHGALGRGDIKGNLGRMHLEGEVDVDLVKRDEDGAETPGKILESLVPIVLRCRREGIDRMPDA